MSLDLNRYNDKVKNWMATAVQQMKQEGLLEAETLGQVVTWYQYHQATAPRAPGSARSSETVIGS